MQFFLYFQVATPIARAALRCTTFTGGTTLQSLTQTDYIVMLASLNPTRDRPE